jgi:hypothetical protein
MSALLGSKRFRPYLRFEVFDVPVLLGTDRRDLPWQERRERLELLAHAFEVPLELSPLVDRSPLRQHRNVSRPLRIGHVSIVGTEKRYKAPAQKPHDADPREQAHESPEAKPSP